MSRRIDISHKTIFFIAGFLALLWALFLIRDVIVLLFVAIIFMSGLAPIVDVFQQKTRMPRALAIAIVYIVIISIIVGLFSLMAIPLIEQTQNLLTTLPHTVQSLLPPDVDRSIIQQQLGDFSKNLFGYTFTIFSNFIAIISILVLTFYLLLDKEKLDNLLAHFFIGREEIALSIADKIEDKLGAWLRGQIVLSLIIGTISFIVLTILQVPYALPLAILAGIFEVVPVIGPIISAVPAVFIAYVTNPVLGLIVGLAYFVIQQLEGHFIVPQVMKKAVGLNPLIIILAVAIGGRLLGIAGALLAVPIAVVIQIIVQDVLQQEEPENLIP